MFTRFEQQVDMAGTTRVREADTTISSRMTMVMLSHSFVQASDEKGTVILTTTDSVMMDGEGAGATAPPEAVRRAMQGKRTRLRIAPDGSASLLDGPEEVSPQVQAVWSGMPATLPQRPIPVRGTWEKVIPIPVSGQSDPSHAATLHATYRLDSVSTDGEYAWITMHGTITRDSSAAALPDGKRLTSNGSVNGSLCVDRKRGWWSDSQLTITMKSMLIPAPGADAKPMRVQTRIVQRMRTTSR
jgi:hypothetical protein